MHTDILQYETDHATYKALVRTFANSDLIEFEVQMLGISGNVLNKNGAEVVASWSVDGFNNNGTFYSDTNGLEMQRRDLNYRPTWDLVTTETMSGNYYPINQAVAIRDFDLLKQLTVMNDRSQGGSSLASG